MLELSGITHAFSRQIVLHGIDLRVARGEIVCLLGPSGCGKTTLLRIAAGFEPVQQGTVRIAGAEVARPGAATPPESRAIGMVFQDYVLFPHLSVLDNVGFGIPGRDRSIALQRLQSVGLEGLAERFPHTLSGGQQQRVALARALARDPAVLLLDEPFSGLDPVLREAMRDGTRALLRAAGTATLMVTHDPAEAMALADRICVLDAGRIVQDATPKDLWRAPATAAIARAFGRAQPLPGVVQIGVDGQAVAVTALGPVAASGRSAGEAVWVMVPPSAIRLVAGQLGLGVSATVGDIRFLGHGTMVLLHLADASAVWALVADQQVPALGAALMVSLVLDRLHVFSRTSADPGTAALDLVPATDHFRN